jgi:glycosyltransferase involved in cell wall biosynthesis
VPGALLVVCITTVARQIGAERALATFCEHHNDFDERLVVVDDLVAPYGARFVEGAFAPREFARLALLHSDAALIAALRPTVLSALGPDVDVVVLIPDDSETLAPFAHLATGAVTLFANRFAPPPLDGKLPDAIDAAQQGRVDQDLLVLRPKLGPAAGFLDRWAELLVRSPHIPTSRLDALTYPWLDSLSGADGVDVVTSALLPLSVRNADEIERQGNSSLVRFPDFNPATPWILSYETGLLPRVRPGTHTFLGTLARRRAAALSVTEPQTSVPAFDLLPNGMVVDDVIRRAYAEAMLKFASGLAIEPPNPFAGDSIDSFLAWLTEPTPDGSSPYREAFRLVHPEITEALPTERDLEAWMSDRGPATGVARQFRPLPRAHTVDRPTASLRPGFEVKGYFDAEFGMAAAAKALLHACQAADVYTVAVTDVRTAYHDDRLTGPHTSASESAETASVLVLVRNADALLADPSDAIAARAAGRKVVGFWFWEIATFPDRLMPAFSYVDEIWVATQFVADAIARCPGAPPVYLLPYPLPLPIAPAINANAASSFADAMHIDDDRFVVSFSFDYDSVAERKNPWAVVDAYTRAFALNETLPDGRRPLLVLKAIGAERHQLDHDRLLYLINDRTDVMVMETHLDASLQSGLFARSNAYISLHRGEGLGLTLVEAMANGTPVVASAHGGNALFTNEETAFVVPHTLIDIPLTTPIYAGNGTWAEPDVAHAATHLRCIATDPDAGVAKSAAATEFLRTHNITQPQNAAAFLNGRLAALHQRGPELPDPPSSPPEPAVIEPPVPLNARAGLGPVVLPGATDSQRTGGSGRLSAVTDKIRGTVEPLIAAQAAFEQSRVAAMVTELQQTRQAVIDLEVHARAERETLTEAITGVGAHADNLQTNHAALYGTVTELSTKVRELTDSHTDLHAAIARIDTRLDDLTKQLRAVLDRLV